MYIYTRKNDFIVQRIHLLFNVMSCHAVLHMKGITQKCKLEMRESAGSGGIGPEAPKVKVSRTSNGW